MNNTNTNTHTKKSLNVQYPAKCGRSGPTKTLLYKVSFWSIVAKIAFPPHIPYIVCEIQQTFPCVNPSV